MAGKRLLVISIVVLVAWQCFLWLLAASITWTFRDLDPFLRAENSRNAFAEFACLGVNILALLAFLLRDRGIGLWLLAGVQVGDVAVTLIVGVRLASSSAWSNAADWWLLTALPAVTVLLISMLRRQPATPASPPTS